MKKFAFLILFLGCNLSFGQTAEEVNKVLDQLQKSGAFSAEQIEATKKEMSKMSEKDYENLLKKAHSKSLDPEFVKKTKELMNAK